MRKVATTRVSARVAPFAQKMARLALLRAELEANAEKSFSPPFWAKVVA